VALGENSGGGGERGSEEPFNLFERWGNTREDGWLKGKLKQEEEEGNYHRYRLSAQDKKLNHVPKKTSPHYVLETGGTKWGGRERELPEGDWAENEKTSITEKNGEKRLEAGQGQDQKRGKKKYPQEIEQNHVGKYPFKGSRRGGSKTSKNSLVYTGKNWGK